MPSFTEIPLETPRRPPAIKRLKTARYIAHRVKESLTTRVSKIICSIVLSLLLLLGVIAFVLWISLRPHRPRVHVTSFSYSFSSETAEISFNATIRNPNTNVGIYYDAMEGTVFYRQKAIGTVPLLYPFYQTPKNTTWVVGVLSVAGVGEVTPDRVAGTRVFRLELMAGIHFKVASWETKRHRMHASCEVGLGADGLLLAVYSAKRCPIYFGGLLPSRSMQLHHDRAISFRSTNTPFLGGFSPTVPHQHRD